MKKGIVSIVGAGPGDPELLTLKALKRIQQADVILYDALISEEILDLARPEAELIYVGKRCSVHGMTQDEINYLLVKAAFEYDHVLRLKGGDPFIFGRGHEEMEYLKSFGLEVELIPGISSVTSLPMIQGVPLTHRGISDSFWVLTGTTSDHHLSSDLRIAMQSSATIVLLMATRKLAQIASVFCDQNKGSTPAMIINNGSCADESCLLGTIEELPHIYAIQKLEGPGIIVIGEVVALHPQYVFEYAKKSWL